MRPPEGWPWELREPPFSIDWPPGFVPSDAKPGELGAWERSRIAAKSRERQLANGHTGALPGLSKKADLRLEITRDIMVARARKARSE